VRHLPWIDEDGEAIREMSIAELAVSLPQMLTWETEPEVRSGDIFVFKWGKIHGRYDADDLAEDDPLRGKVYRAEFPDVYIRLTSNPIRHKKGHWQAPFVRVGFETTQYMKRGGGSIPNPLAESVIDNEVPLEQDEREPNPLDGMLREAKRRQESGEQRRPGRRERQMRRAA
jgi:hypothetical protein